MTGGLVVGMDHHWPSWFQQYMQLTICLTVLNPYLPVVFLDIYQHYFAPLFLWISHEWKFSSAQLVEVSVFFGMHGFDSLSNSVLLSVWKRFFGGSWGWGWISTHLGACSEIIPYVGRWSKLMPAPRLDELHWLSENSVSCMENRSSSDFRYKSVHSSIPKLKQGNIGCIVMLPNNEGEATTHTVGLGLLKLFAISFPCLCKSLLWWLYFNLLLDIVHF